MAHNEPNPEAFSAADPEPYSLATKDSLPSCGCAHGPAPPQKLQKMQKKKSSKLTPTTHVDGIADATVVDVNKISATILDSNKPSVSRAGGAVSAAAVASTTAATAATTDAVTDATTSAVDAVDSAVAGAANTLVGAVDVAAGSAVTSVGDSSGGGSVSSSATGKKKMTSKGDGGSGVYSDIKGSVQEAVDTVETISSETSKFAKLLGRAGAALHGRDSKGSVLGGEEGKTKRG